jgi:hypothetical protein
MNLQIVTCHVRLGLSENYTTNSDNAKPQTYIVVLLYAIEPTFLACVMWYSVDPSIVCKLYVTPLFALQI